jgi:hypothetical protein
VFDAGFLGSTYRRGCLLELVRVWLPEMGDQKNAICPCKGSIEGFRPVQICLDDFLGELAMLAWIAAQSADLELAAGLQGTHNSASLLSRCADHGDQFSIVG